MSYESKRECQDKFGPRSSCGCGCEEWGNFGPPNSWRGCEEERNRIDSESETEINHLVKYGSDKIKIEETWSKNNLLHRENDLPARITYSKNRKNLKEWYVNGERHRENDDPARIEYYEDGCPKVKEWYVNGQRHRENGPAKIIYNWNDNREEEEWYVNDELHRDNDLPARIEYHEDKSVKVEEWYVNGVRQYRVV